MRIKYELPLICRYFSYRLIENETTKGWCNDNAIISNFNIQHSNFSDLSTIAYYRGVSRAYPIKQDIRDNRIYEGKLASGSHFSSCVYNLIQLGCRLHKYSNNKNIHYHQIKTYDEISDDANVTNESSNFTDIQTEKISTKYTNR